MEQVGINLLINKLKSSLVDDHRIATTSLYSANRYVFLDPALKLAFVDGE